VQYISHPSNIERFVHILGTTKLSRGASSGIIAFGSTNAPVEISSASGVDGDKDFEVSTTLAKCVGTATFGGEPISSYVCKENVNHDDR
jgi:hypothetical protein